MEKKTVKLSKFNGMIKKLDELNKILDLLKYLENIGAIKRKEYDLSQPWENQLYSNYSN